MKTNLILIGMPGAGKSTIGVVLAKTLGREFLDTDLLLQIQEQRLLQKIIEEDGLAGFLAAEERAVLQMRTQNSVVATGGSVVYSVAAMEYLKSIGTIIYLQLPLEEIEQRLGDMASRGIAMGAGQKLSDLYQERVPLYEKYANLIFDCGSLSLEENVAQIIRDLKKGN